VPPEDEVQPHQGKEDEVQPHQDKADEVRAHRENEAEVSSQENGAEFARLAEKLITAEQDERRRLALFLHDGPVQSLSGIALMLDAVVHAINEGKLEDAKEVLADALERHRAAIRTLRELSFNLEPVVLRDRGFTPAVQALADELGLRRAIKIDVDVAAAEQLGEKVQAALYQIVREALDGAVRRGPPTKIEITVEQTSEGTFLTTIADDGSEERRREFFDMLAERARTLSGRLTVEQEAGTRIVLALPASAARE
jgi:two-component system sensor histidine kinase DegS